jgi:hypothetical protein
VVVVALRLVAEKEEVMGRKWRSLGILNVTLLFCGAFE